MKILANGDLNKMRKMKKDPPAEHLEILLEDFQLEVQGNQKAEKVFGYLSSNSLSEASSAFCALSCSHKLLIWFKRSSLGV